MCACIWLRKRGFAYEATVCVYVLNDQMLFMIMRFAKFLAF